MEMNKLHIDNLLNGKALENAKNIIYLVSAVIGFCELVFVQTYKIKCEKFYGISSNWFDGKEIFVEECIVLLFLVLFFIYPLLFHHLVKKENSIIIKISDTLFMASILFMQNIIYIGFLSEYSTFFSWLSELDVLIYIFIDLYISAVIVFLLNRDKNKENVLKRTDRCEANVSFKVAFKNLLEMLKKCFSRLIENKSFIPIILFVWVIFSTAQTYIIASGIFTKVSYSIEDVKQYDLIGSNKVIVSEYKDNFVVMNCKEEDQSLYIKKGSCEMMEISGCNIERKTFNNVSCDANVVIPEM